MSEVIRVLLVDDHDIVRIGVRSFLGSFDDIDVVGEAANGQEAVKLAAELSPDIILMDMLMPVMDGIQAIREIRDRKLGGRVIALTSFATDDKLFPAIKAGAMGYLLKDSTPDELLEAVRRVYRGEPSLAPDIARKVLSELSHPADNIKPTPDPLTPREVETIQLVAKGKSNKAIAAELFVSEATVRTHMTSILSKLHLANRVEATLYALREGIASL
ncbi:response regulator [Maridesulfovibrio hydrothermalis]|uniref:Two-component response regulator [YvqE] responding to cell wall stress n=1 Tax=Maridesulfovibrio hydrothermalis AM13 = DSM 14728 TaxID=1121451 RepID=L0RFV2_9BACT|nr:response regulator transcription factor [Maridesulfovibrio hydrothermalis]CCO24416.1 two-component response regulator [YvqE] responding to cell wall stress [Maridesulfovibrio hydrothermalis AM13 = DSM 14728]